MLNDHAKGSFNDASVLRHLKFYNLLTNSLNLPPPKPLMEGGDPIPYFFVGGFGINQNLMEPFTGM